MSETYAGFEQGPIRPPSEAGSLLLRVTRNCPWNRCTFCPVYKGARFSRRPLAHVLRDIDTVHACVQAILKSRQKDGDVPYSTFMSLLEEECGDRQALHAARSFVANGMRSVFLQDANSLLLKPGDLETILQRLSEAFPGLERITSYARSSTLARLADDDLAAIAAAGLNRIHIGMESGSDTVLKRVCKGVDKATQIEAGQKVKRAGIELSEYYMPGLGGRALSRENALETADAMNRIDPDFIRLRTLALPENAPISQEAAKGSFDKIGDMETAQELLLFLESLENIHSTVKSDHVLNLFPEVDGTLPGDKERMLRPVRKYLSFSPEEQMLYSIGRRRLVLTSPDELADPGRRLLARQLCDELGATVETMDAVVDATIARFI